MITGSRVLVVLAAVSAVGTIVPAWAQDPVTGAQDKLLARRAAEADCYRKLAEIVYGVRITSDTYVRDFVTESDEIRAALDTFVKGIRLGPPRYYDDGTCEVDAEVTVAKLVTKIKEIHTAHYRGNRITTTDIENIKQHVKTDVIQVTGSGVPRPELPPDLPEGIEDVITPLPPGYTPLPQSVPAIWKAVGPQGRLLAERAAEVDAMRRLLERIKGLRLTSDTLVRDFITESDEIRTHARGLVIGASVAGKYLHRDELIAEVTMEVPVEKVITRIKELHTEHYHGNKVTRTDITNIKKTIRRNMIRATGSGVPPSHLLSKARGAGVNMPAWFGERVRVTGQGTDPQIHTAQGKLRAARAAELDAMRKLAEQVYGLTISSNTTVRDFVTDNDRIATQVEAVLAAAVTEEPVFSGDIASVTVSMPVADVWSVVHQQMLIIERRG
ncbi:MAG: hypothetical protein WBE26_01675 [Phycisphaerae bacterium]